MSLATSLGRMRMMLLAMLLAATISLKPLPVYASSWVDMGNGVFITDDYGICSANLSGNGLSPETQVSGAIPIISIPGNESLANEINQGINAVYKQKLDLALQSFARGVSFRYEYKSYYNYGSILIYITTSLNQSKEEVVSINFDTQKSALTNVWNLLGVNAKAIVNMAIREEMRREPDSYNASFSGVGDDLNFYVENGYICVLFDKYEIAPGSRGVVGVRVNMGLIKYAHIARQDYLIKTSQYDLKMLPLDIICPLVGYSVTWNRHTNVLDITDGMGMVAIKCAVDENRYYKLGDPPRSLEAAPEVIDNSIYVPISFLDSMLNIVYSVDEEENIILSYSEEKR